MKNDLEKFFVPPVIAESIQLESTTSSSFTRFALSLKYNPPGKKILLGETFKPARFNSLGKCSSENFRTPFIPVGKRGLMIPLLEEGLMHRGELCN